MSQDSALPPVDEDEGQFTGGRGRMFDALRIRNFRWYWLGVLSAFFGMQIQGLAQSWLAYQLTHSPFKLGLVTAALGMPICIVSPFAGVLVDRVSKRRLMMLSQAAMATIILLLSILISTGLIQYWHLFVGSLLFGTTFAFNMPCQQSLVTETVPKSKLYNAIALQSGAMNLTRVAGSALAGALIGFIGTDGVFYTSLGFFILAIISLSMMGETRKPIVKTTRSASHEMAEGFRFIRSHSIILILMSLDFSFTIFAMPYQNLMPVFAELFEVQALGYGFLMTMSGVGALAGSLVIAGLSHFRGKGKLLLSAGFFLGLLLIVFSQSQLWGRMVGLGHATFYVAAFLLLFIGAASSCYSATSATIIQLNITNEVRGRVMGLYGVVFGLMPVGALIFGAIAEQIGVSLAITAGGLVTALFMLNMFFFNRRVRRLE